jgi:hypothetical protein
MGHQEPKRPDLSARIVEDAGEEAADTAGDKAADEARSALVDDLLRSADAAARAAAGAVDQEAARSAIEKIDPAIAKHHRSES